MKLLPIIIHKENLKNDANGRNYVGLVYINDTRPCYKAVLCQEIYEACIKLNPINFFRVLFSESYRLEMELYSHEIETQAAVDLYDVDEDEYRWKEAYVISKGYGFNIDTDQAYDRMLQYSHKAKWQARIYIRDYDL